MDNIAEGFERSSKLEFINSLGIAKGEAGELKSHLYRFFDVAYITKENFDEIYSSIDEITKMITSFIAYLILKVKNLKTINNARRYKP